MALLLSLIFFASVIIFLLKLYGVRAKKPNLPPSPSKLPIIGNLHQLGALPHRSLRTLSDKHGPLMLLHLGHIPTLVISSSEMAEEVLKTHDLVFASRPSPAAARQLLYSCTDMAFAPYGEYWRQVRKICVLELLSTKRVNSFRFVMEEELALMIERISRSCSTGATINLAELLLSLTSGTISRVALGKKYEGEGEDGKNKFADLAKESMKLLGLFFVGDYFPSLAWIDVLTGMDARLKRCAQGLDAFLDQVIHDHLIHTTIDGLDESEQRDFVDLLLDMQKDSTLDFHLTRNNLKAIILDMFSGGTDTTALTIEWAMAELIKHPSVMEKAQAEVRKVVGSKTKVEEKDLHKLDYLKSIIKETLRLHPIAPLFPRESTENVAVQGYHIPAKTRVFINAWAIGREPKSWENADEFLPDRFFNHPFDFKGQYFQFIPFGAGRRGCPGLSFAVALLEFTIANLLYWFDWKLPDGLSTEDLDMSEALGITVHKKLALRLVPKHHYS